MAFRFNRLFHQQEQRERPKQEEEHKRQVTCSTCGEHGHNTRKCPHKDKQQ